MMFRLSVSAIGFYQTKAFEIDEAAQQFNGYEDETATFLLRCPLNSNGLGGGLAPRHLNGSARLFAAKIKLKVRIFTKQFVFDFNEGVLIHKLLDGNIKSAAERKTIEL